MIAVVSNIQSNLEALTSVLADIDSRGIDEIICLGNCLGWGPDATRCLQLAERFSVQLVGDFELHLAELATTKLATHNGDAREGLPEGSESNEFPTTEGQPVPENFLGGRQPESDDKASRRLDQILDEIGLERALRFANGRTCLGREAVTFAMGSPRDYSNGRLSPDIFFDSELADEIFAAFDHLFICGHDHFPGVLTRHSFFPADQPGVLKKDDMNSNLPGSTNGTFRIREEQAIVNCGALTQSSLDDGKAQYLVLTKHVPFKLAEFEFVEVDYDAASYREKMARM